MAGIFRATRVLRAESVLTTAKNVASKATAADAGVLKKGARRDPELYVGPLQTTKALE